MAISVKIGVEIGWVMETGIDDVGIGTKINRTWMVVVEIGIVVAGGVYERFRIGSLRTISKISFSFGVGGWIGGTTCEEVGVGTWCGAIVEIGSETTF